jgi:hypothetical protein
MEVRSTFVASVKLTTALWDEVDDVMFGADTSVATGGSVSDATLFVTDAPLMFANG